MHKELNFNSLIINSGVVIIPIISVFTHVLYESFEREPLLIHFEPFSIKNRHSDQYGNKNEKVTEMMRRTVDVSRSRAFI